RAIHRGSSRRPGPSESKSKDIGLSLFPVLSSPSSAFASPFRIDSSLPAADSARGNHGKNPAGNFERYRQERASGLRKETGGDGRGTNLDGRDIEIAPRKRCASERH